jgi:hypothetical protein
LNKEHRIQDTGGKKGVKDRRKREKSQKVKGKKGLKTEYRKQKSGGFFIDYLLLTILFLCVLGALCGHFNLLFTPRDGGFAYLMG